LQRQLSLVKVAWRYGFLHSATVRGEGEHGFAGPLQALIECPSSRFIQDLSLFAVDDASYRTAFDLLVRWRPATLRALGLGNPKGVPPADQQIGDLAEVLAVLPKLRRLALAVRGARFEPVALCDLQRMELHGAALEERGAATLFASLPASLEYLLLDYSPSKLERAQALQRLVGGTALPRLKHLVLASLMPRASDKVCAELAGSALLKQLVTLDLLAADATDHGAREILSHESAFAGLKKFALTGHFSRDVYQSLTEAFPNARIGNLTRAAPQDDDRYDEIQE
jgi:hypothetical protein